MTKRLSHAELKRRREARVKGRSAVTASQLKHHKRTVAGKTPPPRTPLTQREVVTWALTRVREARAKVADHPADPVWRAALVARTAEYERERAVLDHTTTRRH